MATLGEFLLERRWITEAQLELGLERQSQLGGRLGTCLLELDFINEDLLIQALSEQLKVPPAQRSELTSISSEVAQLLPAEMAVRTRAIPFRASGAQVHVAMLDAADLALEDEISFVIGKTVRFHVAIELRIAQALSAIYGTELPARLAALARRLDGTAGTQPVEPSRSSRRKIPIPVDDPEPVTRRRVVPRQEKASLERIPLTTEERQALAQLRTAAAESEADPEAVFTSRLEAADTSGDVGRALLDVLANELVRVLLFRVAGSSHEVRGWLAQGPDLDHEWFKSYSIGLQHASIFRQLHASREGFRGCLEKVPSHVALSRCWGGSLQHECLMLPIFVRDHLVCVVYGDRASLGVTGVDLALARRLVAKAAIAFERCILKRKLHGE